MLILKRIGYVILLVWGVLTFLFILFNMLPSDPVRLIMGQRSDVATEEAIRKKLGLDKPLYVQYIKYLNDISPLGLFSDNEKNAFFYEDNYLSKTLPIVKFKNVKFGIKPMNSEEAILQMDLIGHNFFVYEDADSGKVNVIYKRKDGDYGLLEPELG